MMVSYRKQISALLTFLVCAILPCTPAFSSLDRLDVSFGVDGKVSTSVGTYEDLAYAIALQDDGKIIVGGSVSNASNLDFGLIRYNPDGSVDTSFNFNGIVITPVGSDDDAIRALVIQDDGRIIAAGYSSNGLDKDLALVRYFADGSLDRDFGQDGIVLAPVGNSDDEVTAISLTADGSIIVTGNAQGTAGHAAFVSKYFDNGTKDVSFGDNGTVLIGVGQDTVARSLAVLPDQKILVGGAFSDTDQISLMLLRFFEDGSQDTSFGNNGQAVLDDDLDQTEGFGLFPAADGTVYIAGSVGSDNNRDSALFRFTSAGYPDYSFNDNGVLVTPVSLGDDVLVSITKDENGIGTAGYTVKGESRQFLFIYFSEHNDTDSSSEELNGTSDLQETSSRGFAAAMSQDSDTDSEITNVNNSGFFPQVVVTDFGNKEDVSFALAVQPDGKMIAAGYTQGIGTSSFALARYGSDEFIAAVDKSGTRAAFIVTKNLTDITRISANTGGIIFPGSDLNFSSRGVVFSIAPDPVYAETTTDTTDTDTDDTDDDTDTDTTDTDTSRANFSGLSQSTVGDASSSTTSESETSDPVYAPFGSYDDKYLDEGQTDEGAGPGSFGSFLKNLRPGTGYYVRAYVVSTSGAIYYGNQLYFTTADSCFIATAAYGSLLHPYVSVLRNFRDKYMISNTAGKIFVDLYYQYSPSFAGKVQSDTMLRSLVRTILFPIIAFCWLALKFSMTGLILLFSFMLGSCYWYKRTRQLKNTVYYT